MIDKTSYEISWVNSQTPAGSIEKLSQVLPVDALDGTIPIGSGLMDTITTAFGPEVFDPEMAFGYAHKSPEGATDAIILNLLPSEREGKFSDMHPATNLIAITRNGVTELMLTELNAITSLTHEQKQHFFESLKQSIIEKKQRLPFQPTDEHFNGPDSSAGFQTRESGRKAFPHKLIWNGDTFLDIWAVLNRRKTVLAKVASAN